MGTEGLWGASPGADKRAEPTHCQVLKFAEQILEFPRQLLQSLKEGEGMSDWSSLRFRAALANPQVSEGERARLSCKGLASWSGG